MARDSLGEGGDGETRPKAANAKEQPHNGVEDDSHGLRDEREGAAT